MAPTGCKLNFDEHSSGGGDEDDEDKDDGQWPAWVHSADTMSTFVQDVGAAIPGNTLTDLLGRVDNSNEPIPILNRKPVVYGLVSTLLVSQCYMYRVRHMWWSLLDSPRLTSIKCPKDSIVHRRYTASLCTNSSDKMSRLGRSLRRSFNGEKGSIILQPASTDGTCCSLL